MISVVVMAHRSRRDWALALADELDCDVVWDRLDNEWETGRRALEAFDLDASHHLVVQDDAVVCRDLVAAAAAAASVAGERPVSFYTGTIRPYPEMVADAVAEAKRRGARWIEWPGPWWGVAAMIPTEHIPFIVEAGDRMGATPEYDAKLATFYGRRGIECLYSVPSLVDHRPVSENPSLLGGRGLRVAHEFIGADVSAAEIDWTPGYLRGVAA